ncbi:MAG: glycine cleavage system protein H [Thermoleophilia bacterium]|nr:glycine cleavage system protein H [Thermoleophilia bacterium]
MALLSAGTKEECNWDLPDDFYYHRKDHVWAKVEGDRVRMGLDAFGIWAAGTLAQMRTFPAGRAIRKDHAFGNIESGKFIGPMRSPVSGKILEVNDEVVATPSKVNDDNYNNWIVLVEPSNLEEDLADLPHGEEAIRAWMEAELEDFKSKDLLSCD